MEKRLYFLNDVNTCICGHDISENCYITDGNIIIVLGNCCIRKYLPKTQCGRTCRICKQPHKNRKNNICNKCRGIKLKQIFNTWKKYTIEFNNILYNSYVPIGKYKNQPYINLIKDISYVNYLININNNKYKIDETLKYYFKKLLNNRNRKNKILMKT